MTGPAYRSYRVASAGVNALPAWLAPTLAWTGGLVAARAMADRRAVFERHLQRVRPGLSGRALRRASRAAFVSYGRYWTESFRLPSTPAAVIDAGFAFRGYDRIEDALAAGKGAIFALPHLGSWEWAGLWCTAQGLPLTVVVEPIEPPELFEWFVGLRRDLGMNVVPLGEGVAGTLVGALQRNEIVCLLCDRDIEGHGVPVDFFGERTTLPAGPAVLALRTGAPILPIGVYFSGSAGHVAVVRPPLDVQRRGRLRDDAARITRVLATELEVLIRAAPEQWHLFQPNWPSDPPLAG